MSLVTAWVRAPMMGFVERKAGQLATAALGLVLLPVAAMAPATAQVFNPTTYTLENGLQVVVVENRRAPIVTHMVWYRVGAADEPPGSSGIAHFLEHLMFKGTKTRANGEFSDIVARNGGRENAFTSQDYTGYFQTVAADRLELMMELEADRMVNLVLTDEIIIPERQVILEERRQRVDSSPRGVLSEQVAAATFQNHPYQIPVIGWAHEIAELSRPEIVEFYDKWYAPNNAILVVAGDVNPADVLAMAERTYGQVAAKAVPERRRPIEPEHKAAQRVVLEDPRAEEPSWSRRYLAPSYLSGESEYAYALEVLAEVFGGGSTSQLFRSLVVDQAVATSAGAFYSPDAVDLSTFGLWLTPRQGVDLDDAVAAMEEEIRRLLAEGVSEDELVRAKQRMVDSAVFARDSLRAAARVLGTALVTGQSVDDVESWPERIEAVTIDDVKRAAEAVLKLKSSTTGVLLPGAS